jgi:hypothetical protein
MMGSTDVYLNIATQYSNWCLFRYCHSLELQFVDNGHQYNNLYFIFN